jgi:hypothetical protein
MGVWCESFYNFDSNIESFSNLMMFVPHACYCCPSLTDRCVYFGLN